VNDINIRHEPRDIKTNWLVCWNDFLPYIYL